MSAIFWILMTIVIDFHLGQPKIAEATTCCLTKKVDGITYTLISHRDTSSYNCLTDCIYKTSKLGSLYCFGSGTEESECITTTTSTVTTTTYMPATNTKTATVTTTTSTSTTTTTSTTTMTTSASTTDVTVGVLITGGSGAETSTELFLPHTGKTCSLQSLPDKRYFHSLDVLGGKNKKIILCGGYYTRESCLQFLPNSTTGSWVNYATLAEGRYAHTSHVFKDALALYGGATSPQTSEQIGSSHQFNLEEETTAACSIPDGPSAILTGGWNSDSGYLKTVARYAIGGGFVENLPDLAQGRQGHVCGHFINKSNRTIMVVAGGEGSDGYLSSTELLLSGATSWISGESLPRTLYTAASVNMDYRSNYFLIIGGYSGTSRGEVLMFNGTWTEVGMMKIGRSAAAATKIVTGITEC